jgi:hypothetical protein
MPHKKIPKIGIRVVLVIFSIALIIAGGLLVAFDERKVFQATGALFNEPNPNNQRHADANGNININTILKDADGNIIRQYSPLSGSVLDEGTGAEVGSYTIQVSWDATGTNINWDSMLFIGTVNYVSYTGIGYYNTMVTAPTFVQEIGSVSQNINRTGQHDFTVFNIDALIPATMVEYITERDESGAPHPVYVEQRTTTPHPVIFVFDGDFKVQVYDQEQNLLQSHFTLHVELRLQWAGSTLDVSWNRGSSTTTTTTTDTPSTGTGGSTDPDIITSTDIKNTASDEFIKLDTVQGKGVIEASIFGGGASEDIGVVMLAVGVILIIVSIVMPNINFRRRS